MIKMVQMGYHWKDDKKFQPFMFHVFSNSSWFLNNLRISKSRLFKKQVGRILLIVFQLFVIMTPIIFRWKDMD
jgi:hypothetical protein